MSGVTDPTMVCHAHTSLMLLEARNMLLKPRASERKGLGETSKRMLLLLLLPLGKEAS